MKKNYAFVAASFLIFCLASFGFGQQTGSLRGTVTDDAGNPLPGVRLTLSSPAIQGTQEYISTQGGDFRFPALPPGIYTIKTELQGFKTLERPGIQVSLGATITIAVQMSPSPVNEQVTVTAASPVVDVQAFQYIRNYEYKSNNVRPHCEGHPLYFSIRARNNSSRYQ